MRLKTSTVGSWPPTYDPERSDSQMSTEGREREVQDSISRAISDQIELGIDILVDGQVRNDVVSLFAPHFEGYKRTKMLPYHVVSRIRPADQPITTQDYLYAKSIAENRPLKGHVTGPATLAKASIVDTESPYSNRNDPQLLKDLAFAIGKEAKHLVEVGATIIQIDEPALGDGIDLNIAFDALKTIVEVGEIPFPAIHVCKNITRILDDVLTRSPIKIVSIEGDWLGYEGLEHINRDYLRNCNKQLGLGCISVSDYSIESLYDVQTFLDTLVDRLGEEHIWALMPNCGLRLMPREVVLQKLEIMTSAAHLM